MSNKQDIVPVTLKSESQHQMNNQKTQTKSTVGREKTINLLLQAETLDRFIELRKRATIFNKKQL